MEPSQELTNIIIDNLGYVHLSSTGQPACLVVFNLLLIFLFPVLFSTQVLHFPPTLYNHVVQDLKKKLVLVLNKVKLLLHTGRFA